MHSFSAVQLTNISKTNSAFLRHLPFYRRHHQFPFAQNSHPLPRSSRQHATLRIRAIDAAQPYDYETQLPDQFHQSEKLKIAIVGFGNFGQFLAKTFVEQGHTVLATSRSNHRSIAQSMGVSFYSDPHDLCEQHPDVILISTAIPYFEKALRSLPIQRLKRNTLFVDVLSVKEFPKKVFLQILPKHFDILCTHPMFGPESGKHGWKDLPFVFDKVRIGPDESRGERVENFLKVFEKEGCRMEEMSCAEHDRHAAESQFITHTVGRMLEKLQLATTPINTKGYETLLNLVENTASDSFDLYYGLFTYNKNALQQLERLDLAFQSLKKEIFAHVHQELRRQVFDDEVGEAEARRPVLSKLPENGIALPAPTSEIGGGEVTNNISGMKMKSTQLVKI